MKLGAFAVALVLAGAYATPAPTAVPIPAPTAVPIPAPTAVPIPSPTAVPIPAPTAVLIPAPTAMPIPTPTAVSIPAPTSHNSSSQGGDHGEAHDDDHGHHDDDSPLDETDYAGILLFALIATLIAGTGAAYLHKKKILWLPESAWCVSTVENSRPPRSSARPAARPPLPPFRTMCFISTRAVAPYRIERAPSHRDVSSATRYILFGAVIGGFIKLVHHAPWAAGSGGGSQSSRTLILQGVFPPTMFTLVLLPPLMFDAGYRIDPHRFIDNLGAILLFAIVGRCGGRARGRGRSRRRPRVVPSPRLLFVFVGGLARARDAVHHAALRSTRDGTHRARARALDAPTARASRRRARRQWCDTCACAA